MILEYLALLFPFLRPPMESQPHHAVNNMIDCIDTNDNPTTRLSFSGIGSELVGCPSTGGVYVLTSPHPVLLQFLSVDRFTTSSNQRLSDPAAEDDFCLSMRKIGGTWWPSLQAYAEAELIVSPRVKREHVYIGWPKTGGVWFMKVDVDEEWKTQLGMLPMALNMDEYCKVLELNGAQFYENPKDCDYLKDLI